MEKFQETFEQINTDIIPQLMDMAKNNAVLLGIALFLLLMMWIGYRRGLFDRLLSLGAAVITLIAEFKLFPYVMDYWQENQAIQDFFLGIVQNMMKIDAEKARSPLYSLLGLNVLAENAADMMGMLAAKVICFILIFICVRLLLKVASFLIRGLKQIHIINSLDKLFGLVFGLAEGIILVWLFMLVISAMPNMPFCEMVLDQISQSSLLMTLYNQNVILAFLADLLKN